MRKPPRYWSPWRKTVPSSTATNAWGGVAVRLFYGYNGYTISATEGERFDLVIAVATSELDAVVKIAQRLGGMAR